MVLFTLCRLSVSFINRNKQFTYFFNKPSPILFFIFLTSFKTYIKKKLKGYIKGAGGNKKDIKNLIIRGQFFYASDQYDKLFRFWTICSKCSLLAKTGI